jgi:hypothetical protein
LQFICQSILFGEEGKQWNLKFNASLSRFFSLFIEISYMTLKIIIRIPMNKRIHAMPTIIHAILLEMPVRNMNKVNMIKKPRESIMLTEKVLRVNIVCINLTTPKPI